MTDRGQIKKVHDQKQDRQNKIQELNPQKSNGLYREQILLLL